MIEKFRTVEIRFFRPYGAPREEVGVRKVVAALEEVGARLRAAPVGQGVACLLYTSRCV